MSSAVRLMTSNVLKGLVDPDAFGALLDEVRPDVLVVQELGHSLVDMITSRYRFHSLHPSDEYIGRGIATVFEAEFSHIDMPLRQATSAIIEIDDVDWHIAGAHLANPISWPMWRSVPARGLQVDAIERWVGSRPVGPVVVAGDFNASPAWPVYRRMAGLLPDLAATADAANTWGWRPGWPKMLRIDHVFGSGVTAVRSSVHEILGSDHCALVVDLQRDEIRVE